MSWSSHHSLIRSRSARAAGPEVDLLAWTAQDLPKEAALPVVQAVQPWFPKLALAADAEALASLFRSLLAILAKCLPSVAVPKKESKSASQLKFESQFHQN